MIEIITGDLLEAKEKYICHQTNCISTNGASGIAKAIFDKYPYANCYSSRTETSKPGAIDIRGNGQDQIMIINLHAQYYPGKPKYPHSTLDGIEIREKYFHKCLLRIAKIENLQSIAFPWRIGCGLAGGIWEHYLGTLTNFAHYVEKSQGAKVVIYRIDGDE
jgi:O-acetyl-ADP-ribose deacetylase (regulator of RNase III)